METLTHIQNALLSSVTQLESFRFKRFQGLRSNRRIIKFSRITYPLLYAVSIPLFWIANFISIDHLNTGLLALSIFFFAMAIILHFVYTINKEIINDAEILYQQQFQKKIFQPLIKQMAPDFKYTNKKGFSRSQLKQMRLLMMPKGDFYSEDLFQCEVKERPIEFGEVFIKQIGENKELKKVFSGLIFKVYLGQKFNPMTIYSHQLQRAISFDYGLIPVSHKDFSAFNIFLKNKTLVNQLPIDFLNFLLELKKEYNASCILKFQDKYLYLAIDWDIDLFSSKLNKPLVSSKTSVKLNHSQILDNNLEFTQMTKDAIQQHYEEFKICLEIIEELKKLIPNLPK